MREVQIPDALFQWAVERRREAQAKNGDHVFLFIGEPGTGKSTLALQVAALIDPTFSMGVLGERMAWNTANHQTLAAKAGEWKALVQDESTRGAFRRDAMGGDNRDYIKWLAECRDLHQFHLVLMQWEEMLEKIVAKGRAKWKFTLPRTGHVEIERRGENGYYKTVLKFDFEPLDGTAVWERYLELKRVRSRRHWRKAKPSDDVEETQAEDPIVKAVQACVPLVEPLGEQARNLAETLEANDQAPTSNGGAPDG